MLVFLGQVIEDDSNHLNNCDAESSERDRSAMIPSSPVDGFQNTNFTFVVTLSKEVPHAAESSNYELLKADQEGNNPKKTE